MKIIFQINGGQGKCIAATAVCKAIKAQYPDSRLIVVSGHPYVFLCNELIDENLGFNELRYFWQQHIDGQDIKVMAHDPYLETAFIQGKTHLAKLWCEMFGIKYNGELPELFINNRERAFFSNQFGQFQKPIMLIQTNGGAQEQKNKYSWTRDLPITTAQQVVNHFANDYHILHIRREDQLPLQNVTTVTADFRALAVLISISTKRLFIDSFASHAAAALGKPSVVCMIDQSVANQFSYDMHTTIIPNPPTKKPELKHSVFAKYNISGAPIEFPYNHEGEIYNAAQIIEALKNENLEGKSAEVRNLYVQEKIQVENNKRSMVASRLQYLAGKTDLSNIKQVLDIGSCHLGQSLEFSNVFKDARIDAFEPVPDSYKLCISNHNQLDEQKKNRIKVHNIALSNEAGEMPFYQIDPELSSVPNVGASSMFRFMDGLNGTPFGQNLVQKEIKVQADTLDNWCKANKVTEVDIMWVDAQGSELLVFQGAKKILKNTKIIMTEVGLKPYYEGHTLKPDIDKYLTGLGFKELEGSFELNGFDYEANTIYIRSDN